MNIIAIVTQFMLVETTFMELKETNISLFSPAKRLIPSIALTGTFFCSSILFSVTLVRYLFQTRRQTVDPYAVLSAWCYLTA
jgi:hypothetical protein